MNFGRVNKVKMDGSWIKERLVNWYPVVTLDWVHTAQTDVIMTFMTSSFPRSWENQYLSGTKKMHTQSSFMSVFNIYLPYTLNVISWKKDIYFRRRSKPCRFISWRFVRLLSFICPLYTTIFKCPWKRMHLFIYYNTYLHTTKLRILWDSGEISLFISAEN